MSEENNQTLSYQQTLSNKYKDKYNWLLEHTKKYSRELLENRFWSDRHLEKYLTYTSDGRRTSSSYWKYFQQGNPLKEKDIYLYTRFNRCVYDRLREVFDAHKGEYKAFNFILDTVEERKIKSISFKRIRDKLFDENTSYINWSDIQNVAEQLNNYYDRHGCFPDRYTELVSLPEPNGTISFSADSRGDVLDIFYNESDEFLDVTIKAPTKNHPEKESDWSRHTEKLPVYGRLKKFLDEFELQQPTLHKENKDGKEMFVLDIPVEVDNLSSDVVEDRVLSVDLGVKKQVTCTVLQEIEDRVVQLEQPEFLDHPCKQKLFRLKDEAENLNTKLARLRENGLSHTTDFDRLLGEYRNVREKEQNLRTQIQHSISNLLVWMALEHRCSTIVFEDLASLEAEKGGGVTSWSVSSWARGELLEYVEYKAGLMDIDIEKVNPWGTSRYCPRCGCRGTTVKASNNLEECRDGGYLKCDNDGCKINGEVYHGCDRDVAGAINVGRKHLSSSRMEEAKPCDYMSRGNYAGFPLEHSDCSSGVSPSATKEPKKLKNTYHSLDNTPLNAKCGGDSVGTQIDGRVKKWSSFNKNSIASFIVSCTENY
ncbi:MAG: zinc ribbon domain-containing protein [Halobacteria archaeon]